MKKKHIFLLFFHLGLGGIQRKMVDLVNYVNNNKKYKNIDIHIIVRNREDFGFESQLPKNFKFFHVESDFHNKDGKKGYLIFLSYLILKYKPVILMPFLHNITAYIILIKYIFFWRRIKVIIGQDNILSFENRFPFTKKIIPNYLIKFYYKKADRIITQTNFSKNDLVQNFLVPDKKIIVIKNWLVNTKIVKRDKKYDLIYCGRFSNQKKLIRVLKIVLILKKKLPNIVACLIGDGPEKEKIEEFIKRNNLNKNIIIKSPTMNVIEEISKSKIFILTSDYEGHPMVLLEAMAQKVVPVVLRYPGVHEYLIHQKNSFVETSYNSMSETILKLLDNSEYLERIGKNSRKTVLNVFDKKLIDKTLESILL